MYQRLPYARGDGEGEDEEERGRSVGGQMVICEVVAVGHVSETAMCVWNMSNIYFCVIHV